MYIKSKINLYIGIMVRVTASRSLIEETILIRNKNCSVIFNVIIGVAVSGLLKMLNITLQIQISTTTTYMLPAPTRTGI